jgi:hypothetical protein
VATVLRLILGMVLGLTLGDALGTVLGDTLGPMLGPALSEARGSALHWVRDVHSGKRTSSGWMRMIDCLVGVPSAGEGEKE